MVSSKPAVYAGLIANALIAITKFIAAAFTHSSAMLSEAIHSMVDTGNESLILFGIKKSKKKADESRPFGYSKELYFWSFIVSILIFAVGGGISFYEGIIHLQHPHLIESPMWNYIVLGIAFLFDGISLIIAFRAFNKHRGKSSFWNTVRRSKDPTFFVVLFEDIADVTGVIVAFMGIYFGQRFQNPIYDGIASIIIGCLLTLVSIVLTTESRSLLMGETASPNKLQSIVEIVESSQEVEKVIENLSMVLGPQEILLVLKIMFKSGISSDDVVKASKMIRYNIQKNFSEFKQIYIEAV
jgi:cation diffusion facilitator family transporter